jgi:hypothetical protein
MFTGSNPARRGIFMGDKSPQHAFFRREVKPEAPHHKLLWHVKDPFKV